MCQGCHGIDGWRTAFPEVYRVPSIGGQHEAYIVAALQAVQERRARAIRRCGRSRRRFPTQDMADLAAYYAQGGVKTASK